jgi:tetratricopeptide (TPR) repeat protein
MRGMRPCLLDEELEELAGRVPRGGENAAHVERCAACRARLRARRADQALFEELGGLAREARNGAGLAIPGYRVESELRRGGQGVVYRALELATGLPAALKVLAAPFPVSFRDRLRFEREIELVSRLSHPGIVAIRASGIADGRPWYAMELVQGLPLGEHVERHRPTLEERLALFLELADAVGHAHRAGVIHRDLKPENVLVDSERRVRVLDFGAALAPDERLAGDRRVTSEGEFLGTLAYAAPEQLSGNGRAGDTRTDVYALGVILYELVTGALPHDVSGGLSTAVASIAHAPPRDPRLLRPRLDPDLAIVLLTCLEKDPERRYSSVEALARDVAHVLRSEPIEARAPSLARRLRIALVRHRRGLLAAGAGLALAGTLGGAFLREHLRAEGAREDARLVRAVIQDLLGAASPQRMGGDVRLVDVIELTARQIETSLEDAPDAQAELLLTIGDTYRRLLSYPEAEAQLAKALARFREREEPDALDTARCLDLLGRVLTEQNRPEAIAAHEEALAIRLREGRELPDADARIAESERGLALALAGQFRDADLPRARALLESALARFRASSGDEHPDVVETRLELAALAKDAGDAAALEALFVHALAVFDRAAPEDPRALSARIRYSAWLQGQGRFEEAEGVLVRAQALAERLYGDELAPELLRSHARLRFAAGDPGMAEDLTRQALIGELRAWARKRPEEAGQIEDVAARLDAARASAAEPPYAEAFALLRRFRGDGAFELAQWMNGIVLTLRAQERARAAEPLLREALEIRCRAFGADCPVRARSLQLLAESWIEEGRGEEARPLLEESLGISQRLGEPEQELARRTRSLLDGLGPAPAADGS